MPRLPIEQELAAVRTLAERVGLARAEPAVLKLAKHTSVRLGPLVARVQSAGDLAAVRSAMTREVAVAGRLVELGAPAVRPSLDPPPGPHDVGGCVISLWSFAQHRPAAEADAAAAGAALKAVQAALARYDGSLPPYIDVVTDCAALAQDEAAMAAAPPGDRALLAKLVHAGLAQLPCDETRWIALHGDTQLGNVMMTSDGAIWSDFEAVCRGPLEWDLADKPALFLAAFDGFDPELLDRLCALRRACVAVWCWADAARSAEIRAAAEHQTARLRREARFA